MCNFKDVGNVFFGYDSGYVHFTHSFENYEARLKYLQSATTGTIHIQKTSQTTIHTSQIQLNCNCYDLLVLFEKKKPF